MCGSPKTSVGGGEYRTLVATGDRHRCGTCLEKTVGLVEWIVEATQELRFVVVGNEVIGDWEHGGESVGVVPGAGNHDIEHGDHAQSAGASEQVGNLFGCRLVGQTVTAQVQDSRPLENLIVDCTGREVGIGPCGVDETAVLALDVDHLGGGGVEVVADLQDRTVDARLIEYFPDEASKDVVADRSGDGGCQPQAGHVDGTIGGAATD